MNERIISIDLFAILGQPFLLGAQAGKAAYSKVVKANLKTSPGDVCVLDFGQMQVCTASAVRDLLVPLWQWLHEQQCVGVVGNADEVTTDEIKLVADTSKQPFICAQLSKGTLKNPVIYGSLEEKMALTLRLVLTAGEADAKTIHEAANDQTQVTVWNNRLSALEDLGLLSWKKVSKTKFYSPVLKGMSYGH